MTPEGQRRFWDGFHAGERAFKGITLEFDDYIRRDFSQPNAKGERLDLSGATIRQVRFKDTNLSRANLSGIKLERASSFPESDLSGADVSRVVFDETDLEKANLAGAKLAGASFTGADLTGANLTGCDASGLTFAGARLAGAKLVSVKAARAQLAGATLGDADLTGAVLDDAVLVGASLGGATLAKASLKKASLEGVKTSGDRLKLDDAKLDGAKMKAIKLDRASARKASFNGADLREASFEHADLTGATFEKADLSYADFTGATGFDPKKAIFKRTRMPDGTVLDAPPAPPTPANVPESDAGGGLTDARADGGPVEGVRIDAGWAVPGDDPDIRMHASPDCPALAGAEQAAERVGGDGEAVTVAIDNGYFPCLLCLERLGYPPGLEAAATAGRARLQVFGDRIRFYEEPALFSHGGGFEILRSQLRGVDADDDTKVVIRYRTEHSWSTGIDLLDNERLEFTLPDELARDDLAAAARALLG